ncbi:hypothetical protein C8237_11570 [Paracidovorax avenae]|nr:hypothetical protein C8237_11570 [Paracidovorax avenae]
MGPRLVRYQYSGAAAVSCPKLISFDCYGTFINFQRACIRMASSARHLIDRGQVQMGAAGHPLSIIAVHKRWR